jgi:hypothetical protein
MKPEADSHASGRTKGARRVAAAGRRQRERGRLVDRHRRRRLARRSLARSCSSPFLRHRLASLALTASCRPTRQTWSTSCVRRPAAPHLLSQLTAAHRLPSSHLPRARRSRGTTTTSRLPGLAPRPPPAVRATEGASDRSRSSTFSTRRTTRSCHNPGGLGLAAETERRRLGRVGPCSPPLSARVRHALRRFTPPD